MEGRGESARSRLQSSGQEIVRSPGLESARGKSTKEVSEEELLQALAKVRKSSDARSQREPQTARALLEENKVLVSRKREEKEMARKKSREFIEQILEGDQKSQEADKAKNASRRLAQQELSRYYKGKIAEKESERANSYRLKLEAGAGETYFPYIEGEHINQTRKAQNDLIREEMRGFLKQQRDMKPGKAGKRLQGDPGSPLLQEGQSSASGDQASMQQPKFLQRPSAHMSRRIQDEHVRKALEDQVQRTRAELEKLTHQKQEEAHTWSEGALVNDALRYDAEQSKLWEQQKNAKFLRDQIEERRIKDEREVQARRSEVAGYWGPDEKECQDVGQHMQTNTDLIRQMEVNQRRRLDSRNRRQVQERRMIDNSLAEITQDREVERQKLLIQREVLTTTWDSQRKIREVQNRIDAQV